MKKYDTIRQASVGCSDFGLVLSGGGAKGAYQAGVWKALVEMGIDERVTAISGTIAFAPTYTDAMFAEGKKDGISIMSKVCAREII